MLKSNLLKTFLFFLFLTPKFWFFLSSRPLIVALNTIFLFFIFFLKNRRGYQLLPAVFFYISWVVFLHFGAFNQWLTQLYSQIPIIHSYIDKCVADAPLWVCRIAYNKITFGLPHLILSLLDIYSSETLFLKGPNISYLTSTALFFYAGCLSILKNWPNNFYLVVGLILYPLNAFFLGRDFDLGFFLIPLVMSLGAKFFSRLGNKKQKFRLFYNFWLVLILLDFAKTLGDLYLIK